MSDAFANLRPLIGDLHNHCGISYGHGTLNDALQNAAERLDFVSVTGHAFWPDIPPTDARNKNLVQFHKEGFARLKAHWPDIIKETIEFAKNGTMVPYLGFETHSLADGDMTVVYRDMEGELLDCESISQLQQKIRALNGQEKRVIGFPHHIGYRRGHRGINWDTFAPDVSPFVEIASMHGSAEEDESARPFLHTMGPADYHGTMRYGLSQGHRFGVVASTDHHSAHPGSYGHGLTGVWAEHGDRKSIWEALANRRTWAMTGDRVDLGFAVDGVAMGGAIKFALHHQISVDVVAGAAIDYVDIIRDGHVIHRRSAHEMEVAQQTNPIRTRFALELGWGPRNKRQNWSVDLALSTGRIVSIDPCFRGREIVSPLDGEEGSGSHYESRVIEKTEDTLKFSTATYGNPTNTTPGTQMVAMEVEMPAGAHIQARINEQDFNIPLNRLLKGAVAIPMNDMPAPSVRFSRALSPHEYCWNISMTDEEAVGAGYYYARVRLKNGHHAWSSPVFCDV